MSTAPLIRLEHQVPNDWEITRRNFEQIMIQWCACHPVPTGGTTGQFLTKLSDDPYDYGWADPPSAFAFFSG